MKTIEQLKSQIYTQVDNSGFLKNVQAQVKAHVLQLIDKQTKSNKQKLGFQYEHPILNKLKNYPLTSLCMDLIQQFLQSFKFKHTLNVFKKEINRDLMINRQFLSKQFSIDLSGKDQSVLLSIVGQIFNGDVKIIDKPKEDVTTKNGPRKNNFMNEDLYKTNDFKQQKKRNDQLNYDFGRRQEDRKPPPKEDKHKKYDIPQPKKVQKEKEQQQKRKQQQARKKLQEQKEKERQQQLQRQRLKQQEQKRQKQQKQKKQKEQQKQKGKGKGKKFKKQQEKPPEGASDLLADVVSKFTLKKDDKKSAEQQFKAKKAFSQQKQPKKIVPQQSGSNKIRGISMGKILNSSSGMGAVNSFMKYTTFNQPTKNEQVEQDFDESKDSTRKNPLYSSSESGFDKSYGYDQSVDSMAIQDYEYVQKAKKFTKKS